MEWRLAIALSKLREQVNSMYPNRSKESDGSIGDAAHATRNSDHNPWVHDSHGQPIVTAIDITHDPMNGFDSYLFADMLLMKRDPRIKYVISNRRIGAGSDGPSPWMWRAYTGTNPHDHHVHISVKSDESFFDSTKDWDIGGPLFGTFTDFVPPPPTLRYNKVQDATVVKRWQKAIGVPVTGVFDLLTHYATIVWQYQHDLVPDGIVGPQTWKSVG